MLRQLASLFFVSAISIGSAAAQETQTGKTQFSGKANSSKEVKTSENPYLKISNDDLTAYADFLRQPQTGLIRLLPREKFDSIYNKNTPVSLRGGGAYFSFARLTHEYNYGSDLGFEKGDLRVGFAGADYGFLTNLGSVALESVALKTPATEFIENYQTPSEEAKARQEARRFGDDNKINGMVYKSHLPAVVGNTYLLRSINYRSSDVLIAFRIVRQDADGGLLLAWKTLKNFPKPELKTVATSTAERL